MSRHDLILIAVAIAAGAVAYAVVRNRENRFTNSTAMTPSAQSSSGADALPARYMLNSVPFSVQASGASQTLLTSTQNALAVAPYQSAQYQATQDRLQYLGG